MPIWRRMGRAVMASGGNFTDVLFQRSHAAKLAFILGKRRALADAEYTEAEGEQSEESFESEELVEEDHAVLAKRERRRRKCVTISELPPLR